MPWQVTFHPEMAENFEVLAPEVQDAMLVHIRLLGTIGPTLGRPTVDTLKAAKSLT